MAGAEFPIEGREWGNILNPSKTYTARIELTSNYIRRA